MKSPSDDRSVVYVVVRYQTTTHYLYQCWPRFMSPYGVTRPRWVNSLRPKQKRRHLADDIFKYIFLNENVWIPIKISLKFVPKGRINNIPALVQIMAWRRPGDKPLSEPMMVSLPTHICVTRPRWVNAYNSSATFTDTVKLMLHPTMINILWHLRRLPQRFIDISI